MSPRLLHLLPAIALAPAAHAAIGISGVADKTKYSNSVTFTVSADPAAAVTSATLDGAPVAVGSGVTVTSVRYHELKVESRDAADVLLDSEIVRFIVTNPARGSSEDGIPTFTPYRAVNDAPSAFSGGVFDVIAPSAWPAGLPIPVATTLRSAANDPLRLNGTVTFGGFPATTVPMRRGWGSVLLPPASAGSVQLQAKLAGLADNPAIAIETAPVFTDVSGTISSDTTWPAHSRIHVTGTLTVAASATLAIGEGTIVTLYSGNGTGGSAAEIVVNGALQIDGTSANPVVFAPDTAGGKWGGIELPATTSLVTARHTIFTGSGEDPNWFANNSGYSYHKAQQSLFLLGGSGSGTAVGARVDLSDCYFFDLGTLATSRTNTGFNLTRCLVQRAISGGQLNGSRVRIDRSAFMEFPVESGDFADADNDGLYLTNGDLAISNTVIAFTKDDGIDSGGSGGDNPFTTAADVTPFVSTNNWFESTYHEANSLSGTRNVTHTGCIFFNCGQGIEDGYSNSGTSDGPNALADRCLFAGNMVGVRWGDNYGSGYNYNGSFEVKDCFILHNHFKDAFSGQWHPTQTNAWIYQTTALNSFGRPYFNLHDNHLSQPDPLNHPANTTWDPLVDGPRIEPFMPVPGSAVGVAISSYAPAQSSTSSFPGTFTVRLSTFSSKPVTVAWSVVGQAAGMESELAAGSLSFAPGETLRTIAPAVDAPAGYDILRVALKQPVNAEVTGEAWFFSPPESADPNLVARGSSGWRYRQTRSEPPADWKSLAFDDSSPAATEWLPCTLPAGFGTGTPATTVDSGPTGDRTRTYYFRRKFNVADPAAVTALSFNVRRDDAVVLWLNDEATPTVVSASATFNGPYTYAGFAPNSTDSNSYFSYSIPPSKLVAGENILAIELHQTSVTSSDVFLDCELLATYPIPLELHLDSVGGQPLLYWFDPGAILETSSNLTDWTPAPGTSPLPVQTTGERGFFRLKK
jgi:hypothetical protein